MVEMREFKELKLSMSLGIGFAGCNQKDEVYLSEWIDEESWESMSEKEQEKCLGEMVEDWAANYIDLGWIIK